jgi:hypothetical protein
MKKDHLEKLISNGELEDITHCKRDSSFKNRIGFRYNHLTVVSLYKIVRFKNNNQRVKVFWECKCDCGNTSTIKVNDSLNRKGLLGTCGQKCPLKKSRPKTPETYYDGVISSVRARYRNEALKRNYEFNLSKEEFKKIVELPCYLCKKEKTQYITYRKTNHTFYFNGIDRLDNSKGYTVENCLPCCKHCNTLKNGISPEMIKILYNLMVQRNLINE